MSNLESKAPSISQVYETVLYAEDLSTCRDFYANVLGLKLLSENELMLVFQCGSQYLLIFNPDRSGESGRQVPSHAMRGQGHIAFPTSDNDYAVWQERLLANGIPIESEVHWDGGARGRSLYVRDPAGNSVEFAPPSLWSHLDCD